MTEMDGRSVVLVSDGDSVHVRDLATRESVGSPLAGHAGPVEAVGAATVAGRTVVVTGDVENNETRFWDLARGEQVGEPVPGLLEIVTDALGVPMALTADEGRGIRLWDLTRY